MADRPRKSAFPIVAGVLVFGALSGVGLGLLIDDDQSRPVKTVELPKEPEPEFTIELPVRVDRSERALDQLRYEETELAPVIVEEGQFQLTVPEPETEPETAAMAPETVLLRPERENPDPTLQATTRPVWEERAVKLPGISHDRRPMLAVVIDDVGIDQRRTSQAIKMPGPMTFAFIPYGRNLQQFVDIAKNNGHEIMLHLPMEPQNPKVDPGPNALLTGLEEAELRKRLLWGLDQFDGYIGLNNHMGSKFTTWDKGMRLVLEELRMRQLMFMDSVTTPETVGYRLAREMGVAVAVRDVFLDHRQDEKFIRQQLGRMESIARERGQAIAIGHPHDTTMAVLEDWAEHVEERGYRLVPVSAILLRERAVRLSLKQGQG